MEKPVVFNAKECPECNVPKGWGHEIIFENNIGQLCKLDIGRNKVTDEVLEFKTN